jgi:hypothetical protein
MAVLLRRDASGDGGQSIVCTGCKAVVAFSSNLVKVSLEPKTRRSAVPNKGAEESR